MQDPSSKQQTKQKYKPDHLQTGLPPHVLNDTLDEMDLLDVFRTFHQNAEEHTFFSSAHGTFPGVDHILGHKSNLSKFKKMKSYQASSLTTTLDINTGYQLREKKCKKHRHMEIKQHVSK